jgi:hypothetical protein
MWGWRCGTSRETGRASTDRERGKTGKRKADKANQHTQNPQEVGEKARPKFLNIKKYRQIAKQAVY